MLVLVVSVAAAIVVIVALNPLPRCWLAALSFLCRPGAQVVGARVQGQVAMAASELETYAFNADISQLMSLIINAFYSNKDARLTLLRDLYCGPRHARQKLR